MKAWKPTSSARGRSTLAMNGGALAHLLSSSGVTVGVGPASELRLVGVALVVGSPSASVRGLEVELYESRDVALVLDDVWASASWARRRATCCAQPACALDWTAESRRARMARKKRPRHAPAVAAAEVGVHESNPAKQRDGGRVSEDRLGRCAINVQRLVVPSLFRGEGEIKRDGKEGEGELGRD